MVSLLCKDGLELHLTRLKRLGYSTVFGSDQMGYTLMPNLLYRVNKTSDSGRKVNRNIYPDAVTLDRMRLIDPNSGQLGPIHHCVYLKSANENTNSFCLHKTGF